MFFLRCFGPEFPHGFYLSASVSHRCVGARYIKVYLLGLKRKLYRQEIETKIEIKMCSLVLFSLPYGSEPMICQKIQRNFW